MFFKEVDEFSERDEESADLLRKRLLGGVVVIVIFFSLIMLRLWSLQIHHGEEYKKRADSNRVRKQEIAPPRGHILDRFGREIVTNRPSFNVVMIREDSDNIDDVVKRLAPVLKEDISTLWDRIREAEGTPRYMPITLKEDIDWETLAYLENHNQKFSGIRIEVQPVRVYNYQDLAANNIGYLGSISKQELEKADKTIYGGNDLIGKQGLERLREADLRGEKGYRFTEVNARGFEQKQLKAIEPLPGRELRLTLDAELQKVAEDLMNADGKAGAVVTMEVKTGRLLTLVSTPSIHLEDFVGGISHNNWNALRENEKNPLINKVVQGAYPPGSTYKMITALAGLAKGVIDENTAMYCPGYYSFGNRRFRCWKHSGHGAVNLKRAISESCDVYFYQVGQWVGVDGLAEMANQFGLGHKSGVEIEHERSGLTPTKDWKRKRYKTKWHEGETLSVAIGQGYNLATPLQICLMTATLANKGKRMKPQLIERVTDPSGEVVEEFTPEVTAEIKINKRHLKMVLDGMVEVVHGKKGTARKVKIKGLTIGGKTGTAQVVRVAQYRGLKEEDIPYKYRDHAWFTCFAPADDPEIAVTVLVEHGLHGGSGAGPIARAVMQKYFGPRLAAMQEAAEKEKQ
ncbi:penicillin-binding protein 2 [Desulfopila sp. IMCC35008]|uniref:penicillin-binding protein 2 n=1 Tax=Desulfopila sp. IMCC35008 TaxID=2653858 RepID=UPI0013D01217|nr:penicillin-binding protein 2 [Desulfopila sp. IMCC35008]